MKITPAELAKVLYDATREAAPAEADRVVDLFVAKLTERGLAHLIPAIAEALPSAVSGHGRQKEDVMIEAAQALDDRTVQELVRAAGAEPSKCTITFRLNPAIQTGARVHRKDLLLDVTLKKAFARLQIMSKNRRD